MAQRFQLFATTAKDERVATFQSYHALALLCFTQQDLIDLLLRYAVIARTFADEHPVCIAAYKVHDVVGNQAVIDHDIRLLDLL